MRCFPYPHPPTTTPSQSFRRCCWMLLEWTSTRNDALTSHIMLYEVCDVFSYVMCSLKFQHVMRIVPLLRVLYRTCTQYGRRRTRLTCVDVPSGKCGMPSAFRVPQRARVIRNPYQAKQKYTHAHAHTGGLMLGDTRQRTNHRSHPQTIQPDRPGADVAEERGRMRQAWGTSARTHARTQDENEYKSVQSRAVCFIVKCLWREFREGSCERSTLFLLSSTTHPRICTDSDARLHRTIFFNWPFS